MDSTMATKLRGEAFADLISAIAPENKKSFLGYTGSLGAVTLASLARQKGVTLFVTGSAERAKEVYKQVSVWMEVGTQRLICMLPERDSIYAQASTDSEVVASRLSALSADMRSGGLIIAPASVLLERFFDPSKWLKACFTVNSGDEISRDELVEKLLTLGYRRTNIVEEPATFAVRGSLLDLFTPNSEYPVRLDFFGDDLDSVKRFSTENQRTFEKCDSFTIIPVNEYVATQEELKFVAQRLEEEILKLDKKRGTLLSRRLEHFMMNPDSIDFKELKPFVEKGYGFLWEFWQDSRIIVEESEQTLLAMEEFTKKVENLYRQLGDLTPLRPPRHYYHDYNRISECLEERHAINFSRFGDREDSIFKDIEFLPSPTDSSRESLVDDLRRLMSSDWAVVIVLDSENRLDNLKGLLGERKIKIHSASRPFGAKYGSVLFLKGYATKGFKDYKHKLAIFTESDIYTGKDTEGRKRKHSGRQNLLQLEQMIPGDIVVHADHGIAEFRGIQTVTAAGITREYLLLQYAGTDKLYVPTDQVHKVTKYVGTEGFVPKIHSLNTKTWIAQKTKIRKNVEEIAKELLELYAKRMANVGFAFSPDDDMQREMEERFLFTETPDQMKAIVDTKADMESNIPMDRLVCGDVGFGKTEVAMRAAFKAVCSGKQVAVLAPTTILAFQHYQTFAKRFEGFPVSVDLVCRLRKPAVQRETLKKVKNGTLDVLIGTHRILSSDIEFKDLGLLVIDEEQRFGVKHKEKLKQLKTQIDVLTLTATPIPRTMQMAMSGIRQISIIDTPPQDRLPVQTYVAPFDAAWVKRALIEELKRGGQIYYVYNRVESIDKKAAFIKELVPEARIVIAHGQMDEGEVEKAMLAFVQKEYDILLATTIIESGLDIPNVNTLIVDEAERYGLSQMYQLRGRVGRSTRQAWAYFFYSKDKCLTKEATERLETIEEHTALGSGFKIALKDLQIRGAGNILGETQSGHIASIGFSLYMELMEEAVARLKRGEKYEEKIETAVEIPMTAFFPNEYIADQEIRIEMYSRLARCNDLELLDDIKDECEDRFGRIPKASIGLFAISKIRILASKAGISKISRVMNHIRFEFGGVLPDIGMMFKSGEHILRQIYFESKEKNVINLNIIDDELQAILLDIEAFIGLLLNTGE